MRNYLSPHISKDSRRRRTLPEIEKNFEENENGVPSGKNVVRGGADKEDQVSNSVWIIWIEDHRSLYRITGTSRSITVFLPSALAFSIDLSQRSMIRSVNSSMVDTAVFMSAISLMYFFTLEATTRTSVFAPEGDGRLEDPSLTMTRFAVRSDRESSGNPISVRNSFSCSSREGALISTAPALLRCRATGICASQQATEQKTKPVRFWLHVLTEQT